MANSSDVIHSRAFSAGQAGIRGSLGWKGTPLTGTGAAQCCPNPRLLRLQQERLGCSVGVIPSTTTSRGSLTASLSCPNESGIKQETITSPFVTFRFPGTGLPMSCSLVQEVSAASVSPLTDLQPSLRRQMDPSLCLQVSGSSPTRALLCPAQRRATRGEPSDQTPGSVTCRFG